MNDVVGKPPRGPAVPPGLPLAFQAFSLRCPFTHNFFPVPTGLTVALGLSFYHRQLGKQKDRHRTGKSGFVWVGFTQI